MIGRQAKYTFCIVRPRRFHHTIGGGSLARETLERRLTLQAADVRTRCAFVPRSHVRLYKLGVQVSLFSRAVCALVPG